MVALSPQQSGLVLSPTLEANERVSTRRANGEPVLHMGFGQAPFPAPERLKQALGMAAGQVSYLPVAGLPELRAAAIEHYAAHCGIDATAFDVIIAPGSKLILYALQMAVDGDLLLPVPSWVSYGPQARMLGQQVIPVPTRLDDTGYHIAASDLGRVIAEARNMGHDPRKLILNTPNNPTGLVIPESEQAALAAVCEAEDVLIIADEIYGFLTFDAPYRSMGRLAPERVAVTGGLSKHLSLGGWRLGIGLIPKAVPGLHAALCRIASETWSSVAAPVQAAAIEAYRGHADIEDHVAVCKRLHAAVNRFIAEGLRAIGIACPLPQGGFYTWPDFGDHREALALVGIRTSEDLARALLDGYGLVALPGTGFGESPLKLTLRLSGCDYDGAAALAWLAGRPADAPIDREAIAGFAPQVVEAVAAFGRFMADVGADTVAAAGAGVTAPAALVSAAD